jgi:hypothetical protein
MTYLHFNYDRIYKSTKLIKFELKTAVLADLLQSDILEKRAMYEKKRKYDDTWFMEKFNIPY